MVFKNLCVLVLWKKEASALEALNKWMPFNTPIKHLAFSLKKNNFLKLKKCFAKNFAFLQILFQLMLNKFFSKVSLEMF